MGPTQGPYILQLCMGPSYFWRGLTPPDPPLFCTLYQSTEGRSTKDKANNENYIHIYTDNRDTKGYTQNKHKSPSLH